MKRRLISILLFYVGFGVGSVIVTAIFGGKVLDSAAIGVLAFSCAWAFEGGPE